MQSVRETVESVKTYIGTLFSKTKETTARPDFRDVEKFIHYLRYGYIPRHYGSDNVECFESYASIFEEPMKVFLTNALRPNQVSSGRRSRNLSKKEFSDIYSSLDIDSLRLEIKRILFSLLKNWLHDLLRGIGELQGPDHPYTLCIAQIDSALAWMKGDNFMMQKGVDREPVHPQRKRVRHASMIRGNPGNVVDIQGRPYLIHEKRFNTKLLCMIDNKQTHHLISLYMQLRTSKAPKAVKTCKTLEWALHDWALILDDRLYPRCEYQPRFHGTSIFHLRASKYWKTYHRSEKARFFGKVGGRKEAHISNTNLEKPDGMNAMPAHSGSYAPPACREIYASALKQDQKVGRARKLIRDELIEYKYKMAEAVVEFFELEYPNEQPYLYKKPGDSRYSKIARPIVHVDNKYPCVVVSLPTNNRLVRKSDSRDFWSNTDITKATKNKLFQKLLVCVFIAYMNIRANEVNIPIEMTLRASFGHNTPSACETGHSFRISTGLIPTCYARLIAKTLIEVIHVLDHISDDIGPIAVSREIELAARKYDFRTLRFAIENNDRYAKLRDELLRRPDYTPENDKYIRDEFKRINEESSGKGGCKRTKTTIKTDMKPWLAIRQRATSRGDCVLNECFRRGGSMDYLIDLLMRNLEKKTENPVESALAHMIQKLNYIQKCVTFEAQLTFRHERIFFNQMSFRNLYNHDVGFFTTVKNLFFSLDRSSPPFYGLYSQLESRGIDFLINGKASLKLQAQPDCGSDSEPEGGDVYKYKFRRKTYTYYPKKLRVCSGLKAIVMAHYGVLRFLKIMDRMSFKLYDEGMYYEVKDGLKTAKLQGEFTRVKATEPCATSLLYFDLNCNNSSNKPDALTLSQAIRRATPKPTVIMLDGTSSTIDRTWDHIKKCFHLINSLEFIIIVESGLKHSQGGLDFNPYGEIRILSRKKMTTDLVYGFIKDDGLNEAEKLSPEAHELVRLCKIRGLATSFKKYGKDHHTGSIAPACRPK